MRWKVMKRDDEPPNVNRLHTMQPNAFKVTIKYAQYAIKRPTC